MGILAAPRSRQSYNAIGDAIAHADALIAAAPFRADVELERTVDRIYRQVLGKEPRK